ncbi:gamma-glutamyl-gamma-aminobutyrate hydrolase family protein [Thiomonas bhubaneswarensis]|uniref:Gamma-glutamyl-gamma-aminobutyrate hydrolase PuuD (Putrescine degradation), contains GATase1-like domain n=1 Tax=Thiomonas bhubaneswarensis TaxID=339866 RepID=A0A0K6I7R1_9BURK|nr:gamma-glutamyl-gamma-aminobutyrate hydrolase family protein [Thiomonas bhubaneswarensis]CUA99367.1 Gamma-glutamyl-gamma-aminobutyrate hydrolase PuuD (putrescine degradation), contains GATase1-like domain [Thiomonas bhubaneswarensis]
MATKPLKIGISARIDHPQPGQVGLRSKTLQYLEQSVAHWAMSRDVLVFMVPTVATGSGLVRSNIRLSDYADALDGLILQGGSDMSPHSYGEEPLKPEWAGDPVRDGYEMELLHEFIEVRKPVLGICRGAQLINVAMGGTLYQDLPTQLTSSQTQHLSDAYDRHYHPVRFTEGGLLARLYPEVDPGSLNIVSVHHQAVRTLGRDLVVDAISPEDGLAEAIRGTGRNFLLGLQWHPEFHHPSNPELLDCTPILDEFLRNVRKRRW